MYKTYLGFFIKFTKSEFIISLKISDASIAFAHKIEANPTGSMMVSKHGENFLFQLINHNYESNIDYYRFFIGWEDNYTVNSRWQFEIRSYSRT